MNLSAISSMFRSFARNTDPARVSAPSIECLESRIAPATLVNPTTVTFLDKQGYLATVTITKPLFTAASVAKVFTFDTGSVNGDNSAEQQLELLNITKLGPGAKGIDITITAAPTGTGVVNVGYINASDIDLGNVTVGGDLGRIAAGDTTHTADGLKSLTVNSLGAEGVATQMPGGNLNTKLSGPVGSITVNGDIDGASIGIGGGAKGALASLLVTGTINGGSTEYSGSIRTQGTIANVEVDGSIYGGVGASSGLIGTARAIGTVVVKGAVTGSVGAFSGAILATKGITSVQIGTNLTGGTGKDSGQVGTASNLGTVTVDSVIGGSGSFSGVILASGNITSVTIEDALVGGSSPGAGEIGGGGIGSVTIDGSMEGGAEIHAIHNIQSVNVMPIGSAFGEGSGVSDSSIVADKGYIGSITATGNGFSEASALFEATITAGGYIGPISAQSLDGTGPAIYSTNVTAGGSIGDITAYSDGGVAIYNSNFQAGQSIGMITAGDIELGDFRTLIVKGSQPLDEITSVGGILGSTFVAGTSIGGVNAYSIYSSDFGSGAIVNSGFDAGKGIGPIGASGEIAGSVFIAGIEFGTAFSTSGAGPFNNTSAASFGFGGGGAKSTAAGQIGAISAAYIQQSTFLVGVHGAGADGAFGTKDDLVTTGSGIGTITSPGGINDVWFEAGSIGATNSGEIVNSTYLATDSAVTAGGIGPITVIATVIGSDDYSLTGPGSDIGGGISTDASHGIYNSTFISNSGIGAINVALNGTRADGENAGISSSTFQAGHALGAITINDNASGSGGSNYGIVNTTFNGGLSGYGGAGDINVNLTDAGPDGNTTGISNVQIDASVCSCMSANMGSITVVNADTSSTAAGIVDSVFRVHGNIGNINSTLDNGVATSPAIEGTTFSAYGSIGEIDIYGAVLPDEGGPSRFLAGYDIGSDMTFGNEDLSVHSLALQGGQSIGNVTVSGYFQGSDIIASINPGAGYLFGDSVYGTSDVNDTNVGAGGSIGLVSLGTSLTLDSSPFTYDYPTYHAIEAANFPGEDGPQVSGFGYVVDIPTVLYVDGGTGDVRITNLTQDTE